MFRAWQLDNVSRCYFCEVGYETINHFLGTCKKLKGLWVILREVHACVFGTDFDYEYSRRNFCIDLTNVLINRNHEKTLVYLTTITNYSIWRHRNDMRYKCENFDLMVIANKMFRSVFEEKS